MSIKVLILDPYIQTSSNECIKRIIKRHPKIHFDVINPIHESLTNNSGQFQKIISLGSFAFVTDEDTWIKEMRDYCYKHLERKIPLLGVCFSHQLMAQAYGSKVEFINSQEESIKGIRQVTVKDNFLYWNKGDVLSLVYSQKQTVTKLGDDLICCGSSIFDYEIIKHKSLPFWGFQAHIEASAFFCKDHLELLDAKQVQLIQQDGDKIIDDFLSAT